MDESKVIRSVDPVKKQSENNITIFASSVSSRPFNRRMPAKDAFNLPSITGALQENLLSREKEEKKESPAETKIENVAINPFSQEDLTGIWKNFTEKIDAPQLKSALSIREPLLKQDWCISYVLDNELQKQRITLELKPQLLGYLRKKLSNEKIEIEFLIMDIEDEKSNIPYTDTEKWQALVEKYPALIALKNRFGLDFQ